MSRRRVKVRSAQHLERPRPVSASRAVGGDVVLVVIADWRDHALMVLATVTGIVTTIAFALGLAVLAS